MKSAKKYWTILIAIALLSGVLPVDVSMAAKKEALSDRKLTISVGKAKTLKLKKNIKSAKWSVISGKKYVQLKNKKKTSVKIVGKKKGAAKVQAKVGKRKYICKVTVKPIASISTKKPTITPNTKPSATPNGNSSDVQKKVASISYSDNGRKYVFIKKGKRLVDNDNLGCEADEVDVGSYNLQFLHVEYVDGTKDNEVYGEDIVYDFSQINYDKVGTYNLKITWAGCNCNVPVVVAEEKSEGLFTCLTNGEVAELTEMRGNNEVEDGDYDYTYSSTAIKLPETIEGATVVQGTPDFRFSCEEIVQVELPQYYSESATYISTAYSGKSFPNLRTIIVDAQNKNYMVKDNVLFVENGTKLCLYPGGLTATSYRVPDGVLAGVGVNANVGIGYSSYIEEITYPKSYVGKWGASIHDSSQWGEQMPSLKSINVTEGNPCWYSEDGVLYERIGDSALALMVYPTKKDNISFTVKENVRSVHSFAIGSNRFLQNIIFKSPETSLGDGAVNGESIRNIFLDFKDVELDKIEEPLYITPHALFGYKDVDDMSYPNIYIREGVSLEHIDQHLQNKVSYNWPI